MAQPSPSKEPDAARKKKLSVFLSDILRVGSIRGFKHFHMYMRGREELVVTVHNEPEHITPLVSPANSFSSSGHLKNVLLPRNQQSLMLSARTQRNLSGYGYMNIGLPPASPSDRELLEPDDTCTVFLLAGYARYCCPYVWVRSNHARLVRLAGEEQEEKDNPLKLRTALAWATDDVKLWDIVSELVEICTIPTPLNPFSVDLTYFECLHPMEGVAASGAMIHMLQRVLDHSRHRYDDAISRDLDALYRLHFQLLLAVRGSGSGARPQ